MNPTTEASVSPEPETVPEPSYQGPGEALPEGTAADREPDRYNAEDLYEMIAEAAYYRAEQRGFALGSEETDWLEAEKELLRQMTGELEPEGA